jgi:hypothetical protein
MKRNIKEIKRRYSPDLNPLISGVQVAPLQKNIVACVARNLPGTDDLNSHDVAITRQISTLDDADFDDTFSEQIRAIYNLSKAASRVFKLILAEFQNNKMLNNGPDRIYLSWFNDGLNGADVGMSLRTFNRGIAELIENNFLAPRSPQTYWVNPSLFFNGDRVAFINEYRRRPAKIQTIKTDEAARLELEALGQVRLVE